MGRSCVDADDDSTVVALRAAEILGAFDRVTMDFTGSAGSWRGADGRDLSRLAEEAQGSSAIG